MEEPTEFGAVVVATVDCFNASEGRYLLFNNASCDCENNWVVESGANSIYENHAWSELRNPRLATEKERKERKVDPSNDVVEENLNVKFIDNKTVIINDKTYVLREDDKQETLSQWVNRLQDDQESKDQFTQRAPGFLLTDYTNVPIDTILREEDDMCWTKTEHGWSISSQEDVTYPHDVLKHPRMIIRWGEEG